MGVIRAAAYGKINLTLDVLGRRADGYHELASIMQSVDLHDDVELELGPSGISLEVKGDATVPEDSRNIAWKAALAFFASVQKEPAVAITLTKRIPAAAGLAGGSADAAAVLRALNTYFGHPLTLAQLQTIGEGLGADVPFCLVGGTQWAQGIGERLTPVTAMPPYALLLAKPEMGISTQEVYRNLNSDSFGDHFTNRFLQELEQGQPYAALRHVGNALETVTLPKVPQCQWWKDTMHRYGAAAQLMSGSGPTVFGIFTDDERAYRAWNAIRHQGNVYMSRLHHCGVKLMDGDTGGCQ